MFKDGVILGADTRATAGTTVFIKNCKKIEYIAPNIYCAGAGSAADTHFVKCNFPYNFKLINIFRINEIEIRVNEIEYRKGIKSIHCNILTLKSFI